MSRRIVLLLLLACAAAEDKVDVAADKVLAAWKAGDEKRLEALAEAGDSHPWIVADELCFRRAHDAAAAFAQAAPVKFYELWQAPASAEATARQAGKQATATYLKQAMEHVRAEKKWKHPYYWAAWQLWGL